MVFLHEFQRVKPGARNRAACVARTQTQNAGKAPKLEPREETVQSSKFKIQNSKIPSEFFKIQILTEQSTQRWLRGNKRACTTVADYMNAPVPTRATVENHTQTIKLNNKASMKYCRIQLAHNQMKPASTTGAKFSRKSFFLITLGPPQHRTALLAKLCFPFFQLLRPSFAASHQSKPRIFDKTCSNLRTQFLLRCLQVWSREPAPALFMISPFSVSPPNCSMQRMGGVFPSHVSRPSIHSRQRSVPQRRKVQLARNQSTHGTSWALRPPSMHRSYLVSWMETRCCVFVDGIQQPEPHRTLEATVV